jgi:alpha-L-fucosidase
VASGTTIGYKRILKIDPVNTKALRLKITDSKECVAISELGVF